MQKKSTSPIRFSLRSIVLLTTVVAATSGLFTLVPHYYGFALLAVVVVTGALIIKAESGQWPAKETYVFYLSIYAWTAVIVAYAVMYADGGGFYSPATPAILAILLTGVIANTLALLAGIVLIIKNPKPPFMLNIALPIFWYIAWAISNTLS